ncbi:Dual specificity protein phosphatase cdc14a, partial [Irineochytrium annulatum]
MSSGPTDVLSNAREFLRNKLYFISLSQPPHQHPNVHFFSIDSTLVYINFYSDFGPSNLAHVIRFCEIMQEKFKMLVQKRTPDEAYQPLLGISPPFLPYRDAGYGAATYHITILDCLRGTYKALNLGLLCVENIDPEEYEFYERVENGDFNWITDKFIAMASPHDDPPGSVPPSHQTLMMQQQQATAAAAANRRNLISGMSAASGYISSRNAVGPAPGYSGASQTAVPGARRMLTPAYRIDDLIRHLKDRAVTTVVRLNNKIYDRKRFLDSGLEHVELYFPDGSTPPDGILKRFLELAESRPGVIAVHCKAGLGRTGTLIAAYIMKHYKFTASEAIGLLRVLRPGSVVGPQQNYLQSMQAKLWKMHPSAKLPTAVSMLKQPTFPVSRRFPNSEVYELTLANQSAATLLNQPRTARSQISTPAGPGAPPPTAQSAVRIAQTRISTRTPYLESDDGDVDLVGDDDDDVEDYLDDQSMHDLNELSIRTANASPTHLHHHQLQQQRPSTSPVSSYYLTNPLGGGMGSMGSSSSSVEGKSFAAYDPMDYEASGKVVDGNIPAQPRKQISSGGAQAAAQLKKELILSAAQTSSQVYKTQPAESWKRPSSAASVMGGRTTNSYMNASSSMHHQGPQTRYQLRSAAAASTGGGVSLGNGAAVPRSMSRGSTTIDDPMRTGSSSEGLNNHAPASSIERSGGRMAGYATGLLNETGMSG